MLTTIVVFALGMTQQLGIGDRAPALSYDALKGDPVRSFSSSKVTVVEFWATWCGFCIQNMPHLSDLWRKHKDQVDFVGVNVMETQPDKVRPLMESMGDKMAFPVAAEKLDKAGKGLMTKNWLTAAGYDKLPTTFIVGKDGKIAWIGHPALMDDVLLKVIDGTWDVKAFKVKYDIAKKNENAVEALYKDAYGRFLDTVRTHSYADTLKWIAANRKKYDGPQAQEALDHLTKLFQSFSKADYAEALKIAEIPHYHNPILFRITPMILLAKIDALQGLKRTDDWKKAFMQRVDGPPEPNTLMHFVEAMSYPDSKLAEKDPDLGLKVAEKLTSMARIPSFLVRLAWAQYAKGDLAKAKATLKEAFEKMDVERQRNPDFVDELNRQLKEAKARFEKG